MNIIELKNQLLNLREQAAYEFAKDLVKQFDDLLTCYPKLKMTLLISGGNKDTKIPFAFHFDVKDFSPKDTNFSLHHSTDLNKIKQNIEPYFYEKIAHIHQNFVSEEVHMITSKMVDNMLGRDHILDITQESLKENVKIIMGIHFPLYEKQMLEENLTQELALNKKNKI